MYGWHVGRRRRNTVAIHVAGSAGPIGESVLGSTVEERYWKTVVTSVPTDTGIPRWSWWFQYAHGGAWFDTLEIGPFVCS